MSSRVDDVGGIVTVEAALGGCLVDLAGLVTRVEADDRPRAEAVVRVLGGARLVEGDPDVVLSARAAAPPVPPEPPARCESGTDVWWPAPGEIVLRHGKGPVARATAGSVVIGGDGGADAFRRVLLSACGHVFVRHDRTVVHAAAIADGDRAVLALGPSGTGKSTLALAALRGGWEVLADDVVALRRVQETLAVAGIPRPIVVPADLVDGPPGAGVPTVGPGPGGSARPRHALAGSLVTPGWRALAGTLLVGHADTPGGTVEAVGPHAVLRAVLGACTPIEGRADLDRSFAFAAALARLPAARLSLGRSTVDRLDDTSALLAGIASGFGLGS